LSFEVKEKDLLARIGKLKTKSGTVETPLLFPVINPSIQPITPKKLGEDFGFEAIITNAYILSKRYREQPVEVGLHQFLQFDGAVMTDSGAYQILVYGGVETSQAEIISYQEQIGSDIATILDIPTGWKVQKDQASLTVQETLRRAKEFFTYKTREDILWVGPVQGGRHLDLVANSAAEMGKLPFQVHALGSPTEVMESYRFDVLADMIMTAKTNLPIERPLHLFGAGHPNMFSLAVALGCDLFDSAAYALYAREGRYMTENGTWQLSELDYFPCQCPKCVHETPRNVMGFPQREQEIFLAEHNLYACSAELRRIKEAIRDGRLWEHVKMRANAHPALQTAMRRIRNNAEFIEKLSPKTKRKGLFFFDSYDLYRPEVLHHRKRLVERYTNPAESAVLVLVPQSRSKPFHKAREFQKIRHILQQMSECLSVKAHVCFYCAPFGIVPIELDEVYPLSQHDTALPLDDVTVEYVARESESFIRRSNYRGVVLIHDSQNWGNKVRDACKRSCSARGIKFSQVAITPTPAKNILTRLETVIRKNLSEQL
jgi:7-cyano-7-deazaguanine tRNA-ribosyltransferase